MLHKVLWIKFLSLKKKLFFSKISFLQRYLTSTLTSALANSSSCHIFKSLILKVIRPKPNKICSTPNFLGLKLPTRMRLGLSNLADHKLRHNFQDCLNPICSCDQEINTTSHFLLHCLSYRCARRTFFLKKLTSLILIFYSKMTYLQL